MSEVRFTITMSLDGYVAGPNQSREDGLGVGAEPMHEWMTRLRTFTEMHGEKSGRTGPDDDVLRANHENVGATIMGRNMFGPIRGPWGDDPWTGWWGSNPPYHHPVFVLTHHARESLEMEGGTTFHFVTDGIHAALEGAKDAAGDRDVLVAGGAQCAQQYLAAHVIDEMELHIVPLTLGAGERLFDNLESVDLKLRQVRVIEGDGVAHLKYRRA